MSKPFRIAHISDSHLGYRALSRLDPETERNQRTVDVENAFTRTIDDILARRPNAVIHSGDLFQHARPTWQSMRHFIRQFRRLERAEIPALVIAGNHDTPRIRSGGSAYSVLELALPLVHFHAGYEEGHEYDAFGIPDLHIHAVPHGALTNPDPVAPNIEEGQHNILVVHGMVPGIIPAGLQAEPGEQDLSTNLLDPRYSYIALGHVHEMQAALSNGWYAGSAERFGWGDSAVQPGYLEVTFADLETPPSVDHRSIAARPMIALNPVYGNEREAQPIVEEILAASTALSEPEAMARVDLRDVDRPIRREVQRLLRRSHDNGVWWLDLSPERTTFVLAGGKSDSEVAELDLHVLFREFVESRKELHPSAAFTASFLERGSQALTDAQISETEDRSEDDTNS